MSSQLTDSAGKIFSNRVTSKSGLCSLATTWALGITLSLGLMGVAPSAQAQIYSVFYTFPLAHDGDRPEGVIEDAAGNLYGTTVYGGSKASGAVFKLNPAGEESVLYNFKGMPDGNEPNGVVRDGKGNLYGTTLYGGLNCWGNSGCGTVFKVDASGRETILHTFGGRGDGILPLAGLIRDAKGNLYGTTSAGGDFSCAGGGGVGCGTIFKLDPTGKEIALYKFKGGVDGGDPFAGVIQDAAGNLYGTALGGVDSLGIVFKLTPKGEFSVLHSFAGGPDDGCIPFASLIRDAAGNLYGTTQGCGAFGFGTVFTMDANGNETLLYSFTGGADGSFPYAGVVEDAKGNLYGTAAFGGDFGPSCTASGNTPGCGVAFKIDATGHYTVLHAFQGGSDGYWPYWGVILDSAGNLYGTTAQGGDYCSCGTVFKITP